MNFIDVLILVILLLMAFQGWRRGVISSSVSFIGTILVIILAFYLKNPLSALMYQHIPFFNLGGRFTGIAVFNILVFEGIAFIIMIAILGLILRFVIRLTRIVDTLIKLTVILALPSKIMGAIVGLLHGYVLAFVVIFILATASNVTTQIDESEYARVLLENTPILSNIVEDKYQSVQEIFQIVTDTNGPNDEANLRSLEVLLRRGILSADSAQRLVDNNKLVIPGAAEAIERHRER